MTDMIYGEYADYLPLYFGRTLVSVFARKNDEVKKEDC